MQSRFISQARQDFKKGTIIDRPGVGEMIRIESGYDCWHNHYKYVVLNENGRKIRNSSIEYVTPNDLIGDYVLEN